MEKEDSKVTLGKTLWWKQHPISMGVWHIPFNQFQGTGYSTINWLMFSLVILGLQSLDKTAILANKNTSGNLLAMQWRERLLVLTTNLAVLTLAANKSYEVSKRMSPGARFSKVPLTCGALNQIFNSKYKEWKRVSLLKSQSILFCNWYFYHIICKTIETSTLNVYKTIFPSRELSGLLRNGSHMKGMWKFKRTSQR